jgi:hypothetical protein
MIRPRSPRNRLARLSFFVFTLTFIASRVLVIAIMKRWIPDFFLHLGGTHVHHLNYGIFLLAIVGGLLLFLPLSVRQTKWVACAYGFGMALTFDEFGMWLHLGGSYWQRASYDAVILLSALFGLIAFAPKWEKFGARQIAAAAVTLGAVALFCWLSFKSLDFVEERMGSRLRLMEETGPQ